MRTLAVTSLLIVTVLAGCVSEEAAPDNGPESMDSSPATIENGRVQMDVPVPVVLIGFNADVAGNLQDLLAPSPVGSNGALAATADYQVYAPDAAWDAAFDAFLATAYLPGNGEATGFDGAILDANAIELYLHEHLPEVAAVPDGIVSLVILDAGVRGHAYHYEGNVGWREPVRSFGEQYDFLVWDPFAESDPWVGTSLPHHVPAGSVDSELLASWVQRATAIRAIHAPIWPPTTAGCHAVTIVLAVRGTTVTPDTLGLQSWDEALDIDHLTSTFENLTQDPVYVDLQVLQLPQDDPALEALTRENGARAITQTYLDLNFDDYHVAHDGCEPYLSLVVYGDLADQRTQSNGNAVMMGASGNRISTSLVAENVRVMSEVIGYNEQWDESTTFERVGPGANPLEWFNWVVAHETGHLFSLPHPNAGGGYSDTGFASTWNVMGYQMRRIVTETSHVDTHNMARNQAAYAALEATGDAQVEALLLMGQYKWKDATEVARGP